MVFLAHGVVERLKPDVVTHDGGGLDDAGFHPSSLHISSSFYARYLNEKFVEIAHKDKGNIRYGQT